MNKIYKQDYKVGDRVVDKEGNTATIGDKGVYSLYLRPKKKQYLMTYADIVWDNPKDGDVKRGGYSLFYFKPLENEEAT